LLTFYNEHHALHQPGASPGGAGAGGLPCTPDAPDRVNLVLAEFERRGLGQIVTPHGVPLMSLERVHSPRYLHFLRQAWSEWVALDPANEQQDLVPTVWPVRGLRADIEPDSLAGRLGLYAMDQLAPLTAGTWLAAKGGADCAINAVHALRLGERCTFALTRPPGHHAGSETCGGACYLNNGALAAQHLLDDGAARVAILDIDYHHGNGTQEIFYQRGDVLTVSIHADPRTAYPYFLGHADETGTGAGAGCNMNLPLAPGSSAAHWLAALETACIRIQSFGAEALVVALGTNGFAGEPLSRFTLASADFLRIGERMGHLGLPTAFMLEGGRVLPELGINVVNVLEGFDAAL
jgi:acetoin utilization deacetylase AcuC-like enzyme